MIYLVTLGERETPVNYSHSMDDAVGYCRSIQKKVKDVLRVFKVPYVTDNETPTLVLEIEEYG